MKGWGEYHALSVMLAEPLQDRSLAGRQEKARCVCMAAIDFAHRFEALCNGRHKSWYLHLFVYLVPRQIEKYGDLWPFCTSSVESRGARIKRIRAINWRSYAATPFDSRQQRAGRVTKHRTTYRSSPTVQILRSLASQEERFHSGQGRGSNRLKTSGRFKRVKMEPDPASAPSFELDPFASLASFIDTANSDAGKGSL